VPTPHHLALRQADQARTDFANIEITLEFLIQRINALPSARDLWRAATLIGLIGAVLGIVGIEVLAVLCMRLDLTDEETFALLNLLVDAIEGDRYPMSPRIRLLREILAKCGEVGGLPPELARKLRRYTSPPPARRPTPEERAILGGRHGKDGDRSARNIAFHAAL